MPETESKGRVLIRWPEVYRRCKKSRTQVWRDVRAGKFAAPVQTGPNSIAWWEDEIDAQNESLPRVDYAPDQEVDTT